MSDKASVILSADITATNEHLNLDSSDAGLETENGGCMHYLYNHTTGGSQLTGALLLMILLYNLYDIENIVFTCRNQYYINRVNEIGLVESLLKLLGSENDVSVRVLGKINHVIDGKWRLGVSLLYYNDVNVSITYES